MKLKIAKSVAFHLMWCSDDIADKYKYLFCGICERRTIWQTCASVPFCSTVHNNPHHMTIIYHERHLQNLTKIIYPHNMAIIYHERYLQNLTNDIKYIQEKIQPNHNVYRYNV